MHAVVVSAVICIYLSDPAPPQYVYNVLGLSDYFTP